MDSENINVIHEWTSLWNLVSGFLVKTNLSEFVMSQKKKVSER